MFAINFEHFECCPCCAQKAECTIVHKTMLLMLHMGNINVAWREGLCCLTPGQSKAQANTGLEFEYQASLFQNCNSKNWKNY